MPFSLLLDQYLWQRRRWRRKQQRNMCSVCHANVLPIFLKNSIFPAHQPTHLSPLQCRLFKLPVPSIFLFVSSLVFSAFFSFGLHTYTVNRLGMYRILVQIATQYTRIVMYSPTAFLSSRGREKSSSPLAKQRTRRAISYQIRAHNRDQKKKEEKIRARQHVMVVMDWDWECVCVCVWQQLGFSSSR